MQRVILLALLSLLLVKPPLKIDEYRKRPAAETVYLSASDLSFEKGALFVTAPHLRIVTAGVSRETVAEQVAPPPPPLPPTPSPLPVKVPIPAHNAPQSVLPKKTIYSSSDIKSVIVKWAQKYGVDETRLLRVANCESGYSQYVVNKKETPGNSPSGIFQFKPQTFFANAKRAGIMNADLWNIENQAQTAAYMFSIGQSVQWQCK